MKRSQREKKLTVDCWHRLSNLFRFLDEKIVGDIVNEMRYMKSLDEKPLNPVGKLERKTVDYYPIVSRIMYTPAYYLTGTFHANIFILIYDLNQL